MAALAAIFRSYWKQRQAYVGYSENQQHSTIGSFKALDVDLCATARSI